jgi:hypothetical protein
VRFGPDECGVLHAFLHPTLTSCTQPKFPAPNPNFLHPTQISCTQPKLPAPNPPARDEAVPDTVKGWRVTYIPIERDARHMDRSAQIDLFGAIEKSLRMRNSDLAY